MDPLRRRVLASCLSALLVLLALPAFAADDHPSASEAQQPLPAELQGYVPGAAYLEGRLRAPCCWNQTIDIHGSEKSNELRREIRRRLKAGESKETIEASIVERYGERILAVPPSSPLKSVAAVLLLVMLGAGAGAYVLLRRWKARGKDAAPGAPPKHALSSDETKKLEARLDAELQAMDE